MLGRLPVRYVLTRYSPIENELNTLIQRSVEHGFWQFYNRLESFYKQLTDTSSYENQQFQTEAITMENIWIYFYIFVYANCFNCGVLICEIIVFHRFRILRTMSEAFRVYRRVVTLCWREFGMNFNALITLVVNKMRRRN